MLTLSYKGFNDNVLSFKTDMTETGFPVQMETSQRIKRAIKGQDFIGVITSADGTIAGVQVDGYVELKYSGSAPNYGFCALVSDGNDGVQVSATSKHVVRVIMIDENTNTVGVIL